MFDRDTEAAEAMEDRMWESCCSCHVRVNVQLHMRTEIRFKVRVQREIISEPFPITIIYNGFVSDDKPSCNEDTWIPK